MNPARYITNFLKNRTGFDVVLSNIKIKTAGDGFCLATLAIEEQHTNRRGVLHSGLSTTLVDVVSSCALLTHEHGEVPSVSVDMHINFLEEAKIGDVILIDAKLNRCGKTLAYLDVDIKNETTGELIVKGTHTKFMMLFADLLANLDSLGEAA